MLGGRGWQGVLDLAGARARQDREALRVLEIIGDPVGDAVGLLGARISLFFAALFLAYGVVVPYFPVWLNSRGLDPLQISTITAAPLFVLVLFTPSVGLLADRLGNYPLVIVTLAWSTLALALGLSMVGGYGPILVVGVAYLLANGTMLPLIETVAVAGVRNVGLDYGRMRLWGSITFIVEISAVMAAPTRPAITSDVKTGPISRVIETPTSAAT